MSSPYKTTVNQRINSIDMLRGLMLVIMTLDHLGSETGVIKRITFEPFGFVSAAEGFIYLSGFVYGLVYTRTLINSNFRSLLIKSVKRASVLYFYHVLVLLIVALPMVFRLLDFNELSMFITNPIRSSVLFSVLLLQPPNMDILPLYIAFLLTGPAALRAFQNNNTSAFFIISGGIWFLGQFNIFQYNNFDLAKFGVELGYFNILSWQFLFFLGVYLGYLKARNKLQIPISKFLVLSALIALILITIIRHSTKGNILLSVYYSLAERSTLGIARLISFGIISYLLYVVSVRKPKILEIRWLCLLGRNSLQVFAYSVILLYWYMVTEPAIKSYGLWFEAVIHIVLAFSLILPAWLHHISVKRVSLIKSMGI
jgi:hypothetical protein